MMLAAQLVGLVAVATFLLSYQIKKKKGIILCNTASRVLYILQYLMLGAVEGAVLDVLGVVASLGARWTEKESRRRLRLPVLILTELFVVAAGLLVARDAFGLLPIAGVVFHTGAFFLKQEKAVRRVSFLGSPFWLVYNVQSRAYGSALGDALTMVSIGVAMLRYDKGEKRS